MELSDEEIIYNIHLGNREAETLLYFVYEKKLGSFLYKHNTFLKQIGYVKDDYESLIWGALKMGLERYSLSQGIFYSFCEKVLQNEISDLYRKRCIDGNYLHKIEMRRNNDYLESEEYFEDSDVRISDRVDLSLLLEDIKSVGETEYKVMAFLSEGYRNKEISQFLSISEKRVSYYVTKVRKYLKDRFKY